MRKGIDRPALVIERYEHIDKVSVLQKGRVVGRWTCPTKSSLRQVLPQIAWHC
jgi:hypothetical protein